MEPQGGQLEYTARSVQATWTLLLAPLALIRASSSLLVNACPANVHALLPAKRHPPLHIVDAE